MTIVEALKEVMKNHPKGLTSKEAYEEIIARKLYSFPAKNPVAVVNGTIRKHCLRLDFATASPIKHFTMVDYKGKKPCFALVTDSNFQNSLKEIGGSDSELLSEEKMQKAYEEHIVHIKELLMDLIMNNDPRFFEQLIVDLLLKMGYGYDKSAGVVVGGSHDGGIDGIISEDKLGLDLIYLQAKRYKRSKKVGCQELQAFVGAMQNVQKGVFITTSYFTREAKEYAITQQQKNLKLIDGEMLAGLMIRYEIGIIPETAFKIYKIDQSYFE